MAEEYSEPVIQVERGRKRRKVRHIRSSGRYREENAGPLDARCGHLTSDYTSVRGPRGCYAAELTYNDMDGKNLTILINNISFSG